MIHFPYGYVQRFRRRHDDINIIGRTDAVLPQASSSYRLNRGGAVHFYIEPAEKPSDPPAFPYGMRTPGCHRLRKFAGWFNLEIPADNAQLEAGWNTLDIEITGNNGELHRSSAKFHWNPQPQDLPLDLSDLRRFQSIQEVGQAVNGLFELDRDRNVIRAANPVGSDILLLLGSPGLSQEATYCIEFGSGKGVYLGLSDFFAGHLPQSADLGIKPGYCTNGLATLDRNGDARAWIAHGDNLMDDDSAWVVSTGRGQHRIAVQSGRKYRVRHQFLTSASDTSCRFRIWPDGTPEPQTWLCEANTTTIAPHLPRNPTASFGLFQYFGSPTEWSDIQIRPLDIGTAPDKPTTNTQTASSSLNDASPEQRNALIQKFCDAYVNEPNPTRAALVAGFQAEEAEAVAHMLLRQPAIRQHIQPQQVARQYREDPRYKSPCAPVQDNVYYCCAQKSGSQWLKSLFFDAAVYRASGLKVYPYVLHGNKFARFSEPFPAHTIATHLYVGYDAYKTIPKPESYKTFYVLRDPRDTLVSWYYSARNSHVPIEPIPRLRSELQQLDFESGMMFMIDFLCEWQFFDCQRSWMERGIQDPQVRIFRYEQLAGDEAGFARDLFNYLAIEMPETDFTELCDRHAFSRFAHGRKKGEEDQQSHYRAGRQGDWQIKFTDRIGAHFQASTGNLVDVLGYSQ